MISKILVKKAQRLFLSKIVHTAEISAIEDKLNVKLNTDFLYLCEHANHEYSSRFDWAGFSDGIIIKTICYRAEGLPNRYIILADQGDAGIVLMETQNDRDKPSPVIWCDYPDIFNLCECGEFKLNPDIWPSFTDFFEYLVEQEEKLQNEELN